MCLISVEEIDSNNISKTFSVTVARGDNEYDYTVTADSAYVEKLAKGRITTEKLVEKSFRFLLAHEPPEAILRAFNLSVIERYFPNYSKTVMSY